MTTSRAEIGPWGPWLTLTFSFAVYVGYAMAQAAGMLPLLVIGFVQDLPAAQIPSVMMMGFNLALAISISCPFMVVACGLLAWARRGPLVGDYLAVRPVKPGPVIGWTLGMMGVSVAMAMLNEFLQRPVPAFIESTFDTAMYLPVFWAGIAFCAPLAEEALFRGFMFAGLSASRLGEAGTVVVTSVLFMLLHWAQYEWVELLQIAVVGVMLGTARVRTGSIVVPLVMHVALNLTSLAVFELTERR